MKKSDFGVCDFAHLRTLVSIGYDIKTPEYLYLDQVANLQKDPSRGFWCTMDNETMRKKLIFTDSGLRTMQRRLKSMGLLEVQDGNKTGKRVTAAFFNCIPSESLDRQIVTDSPSDSDGQVRQIVTDSPSDSDDKRKEKENKRKVKESKFQIFFKKFDDEIGISSFWKSKDKKASLKYVFDSLTETSQEKAIEGITSYKTEWQRRKKTHKDLIAVNPKTYMLGNRWEDAPPEGEKSSVEVIKAPKNMSPEMAYLFEQAKKK